VVAQGEGSDLPAASVMWEAKPGHFGGAFSKLIVRPETCGAKALDYRISV